MREAMASRRETVLTALHARLSKLGETRAVTVLRGGVLPERVPKDGLLILRDGEPGKPEVVLSPPRYYYAHECEIETIVQCGDAAERDRKLDSLCQSIGGLIASDRALGGKCCWMEAQAPQPVELAVEGASGIKAAIIALTVYYETGDPLIGSPPDD